jgi:flagellar hook assembly protein FlgD
VITLINGFQEKGYKTVQWKGLGQNGIKVSSGIYFYRLLSEDYMATKKMIFLK